VAFGFVRDKCKLIVVDVIGCEVAHITNAQ
jgi:hypothetical protein